MEWGRRQKENKKGNKGRGTKHREYEIEGNERKVSRERRKRGERTGCLVEKRRPGMEAVSGDDGDDGEGRTGRRGGGGGRGLRIIECCVVPYSLAVYHRFVLIYGSSRP